jgi:hypothetical protein
MSSYPISQDVYQKDKLIGSCPTGLLCNKRVMLNPRYPFMIHIREYKRENIFLTGPRARGAGAGAGADTNNDDDDNTYCLVLLS